MNNVFTKNALIQSAPVRQLKRRLAMIILSGFVLATASLLLTGCGTIRTTTTQKPDGSIITQVERPASWLGNSTIAASGSVQAVKIEPTGGGSSSAPLANVTLGGANNAITSSPIDDKRPVASYSKSMSLFGSVTSASASGVSWTYIGTPNETAAETAARLKSFKALSEDTSTTTAVTTGTTNTTTAATTAAPAATTTVADTGKIVTDATVDSSVTSK